MSTYERSVQESRAEGQAEGQMQGLSLSAAIIKMRKNKKTAIEIAKSLNIDLQLVEQIIEALES